MRRATALASLLPLALLAGCGDSEDYGEDGIRDVLDFETPSD